ncbi:hypothetical protein K438DRAFT_2103590 [Mycena galopus ATCC 62051]|nr:hypothetical protein K438DRAFT_2103590 [Mycena galopus ATCC 62051]
MPGFRMRNQHKSTANRETKFNARCEEIYSNSKWEETEGPEKIEHFTSSGFGCGESNSDLQPTSCRARPNHQLPRTLTSEGGAKSQQQRGARLSSRPPCSSELKLAWTPMVVVYRVLFFEEDRNQFLPAPKLCTNDGRSTILLCVLARRRSLTLLAPYGVDRNHSSCLKPRAHLASLQPVTSLATLTAGVDKVASKIAVPFQLGLHLYGVSRSSRPRAPAAPRTLSPPPAFSEAHASVAPCCTCALPSVAASTAAPPRSSLNERCLQKKSSRLHRLHSKLHGGTRNEDFPSSPIGKRDTEQVDFAVVPNGTDFPKRHRGGCEIFATLRRQTVKVSITSISQYERGYITRSAHADEFRTARNPQILTPILYEVRSFIQRQRRIKRSVVIFLASLESVLLVELDEELPRTARHTRLNLEYVQHPQALQMWVDSDSKFEIKVGTYLQGIFVGSAYYIHWTLYNLARNCIPTTSLYKTFADEYRLYYVVVVHPSVRIQMNPNATVIARLEFFHLWRHLRRFESPDIHERLGLLAFPDRGLLNVEPTDVYQQGLEDRYSAAGEGAYLALALALSAQEAEAAARKGYLSNKKAKPTTKKKQEQEVVISSDEDEDEIVGAEAGKQNQEGGHNAKVTRRRPARVSWGPDGSRAACAAEARPRAVAAAHHTASSLPNKPGCVRLSKVLGSKDELSFAILRHARGAGDGREYVGRGTRAGRCAHAKNIFPACVRICPPLPAAVAHGGYTGSMHMKFMLLFNKSGALRAVCPPHYLFIPNIPPRPRDLDNLTRAHGRGRETGAELPRNAGVRAAQHGRGGGAGDYGEAGPYSENYTSTPLHALASSSRHPASILSLYTFFLLPQLAATFPRLWLHEQVCQLMGDHRRMMGDLRHLMAQARQIRTKRTKDHRMSSGAGDATVDFVLPPSSGPAPVSSHFAQWMEPGSPPSFWESGGNKRHQQYDAEHQFYELRDLTSCRAPPVINPAPIASGIAPLAFPAFSHRRLDLLPLVQVKITRQSRVSERARGAHAVDPIVASLQTELSEVRGDLALARNNAEAEPPAETTQHVHELEDSTVDIAGEIKLAQAEAKV